MEAWVRRRSEFNHDWLKARYLNALGSFIIRLEDAGPDATSKIEEFLIEDFQEWAEQSTVAMRLIREFGTQMSPARQFDVAPLAGCTVETRGWLAPIVHQMWMLRSGAEPLVTEALALVERVDEKFKDLQSIVAEAGRTDLLVLKGSLPRWREFADACRRLGDHLSKFPNQTEFT